MLERLARVRAAQGAADAARAAAAAGAAIAREIGDAALRAAVAPLLLSFGDDAAAAVTTDFPHP
jgi:hypothetical protein